jgi:uncharacterized protein (TIGR02284 family)
MLRNELQITLNDLIVACLEAADGHEAAAEILGDDPLAEALRSLAGARRALAGQFGEHLRALGDLPREPDADLETVRELAARVMAALSADHRRVLLDERSAAEAHLAAGAEAALAHGDLSDETGALVRRVRDDAQAAQHHLATLYPSG